MIRLFQRKPPPLIDFAMIRGGSTERAQKLGSRWDSAYVSDNENQGAQDLALRFVSYHRELVGQPPMKGFIEPDASSVNERALWLARNATERSKVLLTNLSHSSVEEAIDKLGLEAIVVDADPSQNYQVNDAQIARAIGSHSNEIAAVVSTYGTTQLGNIERLAESPIVQELRANGSWLHIDAAYGGYLGMLSAHVKRKIPDADTITIDPYKFIGRPGCALLLIDQDKAPTPESSYYPQSPFTFRTSL